MTDEIKSKIREYEGLIDSLDLALDKSYVEIDYYDIAKYNPDLTQRFDHDTSEELKIFEIALKNKSDKEITPRIKNLPKDSKILIREIRGTHYKKLISVEGRIKSKSKVRDKIVIAKFECPSCGNTINVLVFNDLIQEPTRCGCGRKGRFIFLEDGCEKAPVFVINLQEPEDMVKIGSDLQNLTCIFEDDMCDFEKEQLLYNGCRVILNGWLEPIITKTKNGIKAIIDHIFVVNSVQSIEGDFTNIKITKEDEAKIKELAARDDCLDLLSKSIYQKQIYGNEDVKKSIILSMFGGNTFIRNRLKNRGLIHILLIGDPGSGKSDILLLTIKNHPKARYINVAGGAASSVGLTSSVEKDALTDEWTFSAGAIPMMHKGMIGIDELNGLQDPQSLQECMEQLTVTVAKANIQAQLLAETTILAACNPKSGRFDPFKSIYEQIDLPPPLVNRFDLVYPFKDIRDPNRDGNVAEAILNRHMESIDDEAEAEDIISTDLIKKWIIYAQKLKPSIPESIKQYMKEIYIEIRNPKNQNPQTPDEYRPIPISPRQLQAMIRLSEAYAKIKLLSEVNEIIAKFAVRQVVNSLELIGVDPETGLVDIQKIEGSLVASKRQKVKIVKDIIYSTNQKIAIEEVIKLAGEKGVIEAEIEELLEILSRNGEIFSPIRDYVQRLD